MKKRYTYSGTLLMIVCNFICCTATDELNSNPEVKVPSYFVNVIQSSEITEAELQQKVASRNAGNFLPQANLSLRVEIDAIRYRTTDPCGNPIIASGIISYPRHGNFKGIILGEHYTMTDNPEAPSVMMGSVESLYSFMDYVVVSPDYIGFGETVTLPHPYLHVKSTGRASVDMFFAAREYMESIQKPIGSEIYIVGYSQGGASALSVQKIIEEHYADKISIKRVMAGGGPYDLVATGDFFIHQDRAAYPCSVPYLALGLDYGDNLGLNYSNVFQGELLKKYNEWFNSKKYSSFKINGFLNTDTISSFMHPDLFLPDMNPDLRRLYDSFEKNSLINWIPKSPILMIHGKEDTYVPLFNAQNAYKSFKEQGCDIELVLSDWGHLATVAFFYLNVTKALW